MILFDRYGRIPIMKIGTIGSIVGLLIASYGLYTHDTGYITIFGILFLCCCLPSAGALAHGY